MNADDKILYSFLEEKARQCADSQMITNSRFLDMHQRSVAASIRLPYGVRRIFYGGFDGAERSVAVYLPEYIEAKNEAELNEYFKTVPQDCPISVLEVKKDRFSKPLTHRDYLGSLMALGIERDMTGDIAVNENGCHIAVIKNMAGYISENMSSAGRGTLTVRETQPWEAENITYDDGKEDTFTVSSARLDSMVKNAFGISREGACDAITHGYVFVNDTECLKPDRKINVGDKITMRHKGRIIVTDFPGRSKKGREIVRIKSFVKK